MGIRHRYRRSDLFLLRVWSEETENGAITWCGKVQRTTTGEARFFRDWPQLIDLLLTMLPVLPAPDGGRPSAAGLAVEVPASGTVDRLAKPTQP